MRVTRILNGALVPAALPLSLSPSARVAAQDDDDERGERAGYFDRAEDEEDSNRELMAVPLFGVFDARPNFTPYTAPGSSASLSEADRALYEELRRR